MPEEKLEEKPGEEPGENRGESQDNPGKSIRKRGDKCLLYTASKGSITFFVTFADFISTGK